MMEGKAEMKKNSMRKWLAVMLALVLALSCAAASAQTVSVKLAVDTEAVKTLATAYGMPEEQASTIIDPIAALINALGVKVITAADGAQIDLELKDKNALSLGFATTEEGTALVSTLIPNYMLTVKPETLEQLMSSFMQNMPGAGAAGAAGGFDMSAMAGMIMPYVMPFTEAFQTAVVPGEPVPGEYEIDGVTFDTMVPVDIDVDALAAATRTMLDGMMNDEKVVSLFQSFGQFSGGSFNVEDMKKNMDEFIAHFPKTVTATVYNNSDGSPAYYVEGTATDEGKEEPSYGYTMLILDEKTGKMSFFVFEQEIITSISYGEDGFTAGFYQGESSIVLDVTSTAGDPMTTKADLYISSETPLLTITVAQSQDSTRTLPVEAGEKTVVAVEELMSSQGGSEAVQGLTTELMSNGLPSLLTSLAVNVPEAASLLSMLMAPAAQ